VVAAATEVAGAMEGVEAVGVTEAEVTGVVVSFFAAYTQRRFLAPCLYGKRVATFYSQNHAHAELRPYV